MVNTYCLNPWPYKCVATILRFQRTTWEAGDRKGIPHFDESRTNHCPESTSTLLTPEPDRTVLNSPQGLLLNQIDEVVTKTQIFFSSSAVTNLMGPAENTFYDRMLTTMNATSTFL
ncbi:hypothetical protein GQ457_04G008920 [Hibiscus cannabinus]